MAEVAKVGGRARRRRRGRTALVCAGGGITGAVYEIGCLRALEDMLDRSVLDLDLYVGVSGGAFVASLLAAGVSPAEMYEVVSAAGPRSTWSELPLFRLGLAEFARRSVRVPGVLANAVRETLAGPAPGLYDVALSLFEALPAGLLDSSGLQEYIAAALRQRGIADSFRGLPRELHVVAVDLDNGEAVAFGEREHPNVSVSRAVQASAALPGLYRPVRIDGRDFVDGGVKKTAHINLAIREGADLVVCINPIVPFRNDAKGAPFRGHLSDHGMTWVLDQVLRIMLHGRMEYGLERYRNEHPDVDIVVLQPTRDDLRMFRYNIMRYSARRVVAEYGYRSAREAFRREGARYGRLFARHGIFLRPPATLPDAPVPLPYRSDVGRELGASLDRLERRLERRQRA
jgi:predicted acylesterase/phospholipase RssA